MTKSAGPAPNPPPAIWLGGGSAAGKTTIARTLAHRYDLALYAVDARAYDHHGRLLARRTADQPAESYDERWLTPSVDTLVQRFVDAATETFPLIVDDLGRLGGDVLVVVEGPQLFPELVAPLLGDPARGLWLLPTEDFATRALATRSTNSSAFTSDADRALRKRLDRDVRVRDRIRDSATQLGFPVIDVDGTIDVPTMVDRVATHFASPIEAGPRMSDGCTRTRRRQAENAAAVGNVRAYLAELGDAAPDPPPPVGLACECRKLGCTSLVQRVPDEYVAAAATGRPTVADGHQA